MKNINNPDYSNTYKFLVLSISAFKNKKLNEIFQNSMIGT